MGSNVGQKSGVVNQIKEIRARYRDGDSYSELFSRLSAIEVALKDFEVGNKEFLRYFPVAMVACIEGYFRLVIRELIDHGEPFLSRAEVLLRRDLKLDFLILKELHGDSLTLGELIAHLSRCNKLSDIDSNISQLLGSNFLEGLKRVYDRWEYEVSKKPKVLIIPDPKKTYANVEKTFSMRHIICHEFANDSQFSSEEIRDAVEECVRFLRASRELIAEAMHPGYPLTQDEMNEWSGAELKKSLDLMSEVELRIKTLLDVDEIIRFEELQREWQAYSEKWISFDADNYLGGTIRPSIYSFVYKLGLKFFLPNNNTYENNRI